MNGTAAATLLYFHEMHGSYREATPVAARYQTASMVHVHGATGAGSEMAAKGGTPQLPGAFGR